MLLNSPRAIGFVVVGLSEHKATLTGILAYFVVAIHVLLEGSGRALRLMLMSAEYLSLMNTMLIVRALTTG